MTLLTNHPNYKEMDPLDPALRPFYTAWVNDLTELQLHSKADIASVLAWQSLQISKLESMSCGLIDICIDLVNSLPGPQELEITRRAIQNLANELKAK